MERKGKLRSGLLCLFLLLAFGMVPAREAKAAGSSVIERITLKVMDQYGKPEELLPPKITSGTAGTTISGITYSKQPENWTPGKPVTITVILSAESGRYFASNINREKCSITGADFLYAGERTEGTLRVRLSYIPVTVLGNTKKAGFDESFTKALFEPVRYAPGYEVTLYSGSKKLKTLKVTGNRVDLSPYIKGLDQYMYEVKAIPMTAEEKKYLKPGEAVTGAPERIDLGGGVVAYGVTPQPSPIPAQGSGALSSGGTGNAAGWYGPDGIWYYYENGVMATGWRMIQGQWYYFHSNGVMQTGFLYLRDGTYYLEGSGRMRTGWVLLGNDWYYFNSSGRMQTGWIFDGGKLYYLDPYGKMLKNTVVNNHTLGADGAVIA